MLRRQRRRAAVRLPAFERFDLGDALEGTLWMLDALSTELRENGDRGSVLVLGSDVVGYGQSNGRLPS